MKGDFSRGSNPDRKRGKAYRRVLLQQRRLLLDSDLAAMSDAQDQLVRGATRDFGGAAGSPDLGYLVTPGKLQAVFEHLDHVAGEGPQVFHRDYSHKHLGRFPSLYLIHPGGAAGRVWIRVLAGLAPGPTQLVLWARADEPANLLVGFGGVAQSVPVPAGGDFQRLSVNLTVPDPFDGRIAIGTPAGSPGVWLGMIESHEQVATAPYFWVAQGRYHVHGLAVTNPAHQGYPEVSFPAAAGFSVTDVAALPGDARVAAYLETWERGITHVEDRGIREEALGGGQDTTVRTQAMGQVKLVPIGARTADEVRRAFASAQTAAGTLDIEVQAVDADPDPCALPLSGGYTGRDNRLYWFEVHTGGALGTAMLKWSRDNASEIFAVQETSGSVIKLTRGTGLRDGDIVEVLSEVIDLGDATPASFSGDQLVPARRMVGELALLVALPAEEESREPFRLVAVDNPQIEVVPGSDPVRYGADGVRVSKVRRWHGVLRTQAAAGPDPHNTITLEDGIEVTLRGPFEVGSYWQYEARRGQQNDNGDWQATPHGPERRRALLALMRKPTDVNQPMVLESWLDERYSPLPELDADDIAYDGAAVGESVDTVQEAIDELFRRQEQCGDLVVHPGPGWEAVFDRIPPFGDAHVCFQSGTYWVTAPIVISGRGHIRITGAGPGSRIIAPGAEAALIFSSNASVEVSDVYVEAGKTGRGPTHAGINGAVTFEGCTQVSVLRSHFKCAADFERRGACISTRGCERVRVDGCTLQVGHQQVGIQVVDASETSIERNHLAVYEKPEYLFLENVLEVTLYRKSILPLLVRNIAVGNLPNDGLFRNVQAGWAQLDVFFGTEPPLVNPWLAVLGNRPPPGFGDSVIRKHIRQLADEILSARGQISETNGFANWLQSMASQALPAMFQGIVVAGATVGLTRISDNVVMGALQGIHVGASWRNQPTMYIQRVAITGNEIRVTMPFDALRARHGIFVGNGASVLIENNTLHAIRAASTGSRRIDGIRLYGAYLRFVIIRQNHLSQFQTGIRMVQDGPSYTPVQWRATNNLAEGATEVFSADTTTLLVRSENYS